MRAEAGDRVPPLPWLLACLLLAGVGLLVQTHA